MPGNGIVFHAGREDVYFNPLVGIISAVEDFYVTQTLGRQGISVQLYMTLSTKVVPLSQCRNCRKGDYWIDLAPADGTTSVLVRSSAKCCKQ